jgi:thiamine biosynthesis lipoprotein
MDTLITATVISRPGAGAAAAELRRALCWFALVEYACSRFEPGSEVTRLASSSGAPVRVSPVVFEAVRIALAVAEASNGAFDPTVGGAMQRRGYDRNYRTGARVHTPVAANPSWRDVELDPDRSTIRLRRPALLDLGAIAKGLAVDLAIGELARFPGAIVEAGGDLRVRGTNEHGEPWRVGVRDPQNRRGLVLTPGDAAVCSSSGCARPGPHGGHHLLDPRSGCSPGGTLGVTVIAPACAAADALATAAFVLGPADGVELLEREGVLGMIVTREGSWHTHDLQRAADVA